MRKSGAGWRKHAFGKAYKIDGYQDFVVEVSEKVDEPTRRGTGLWVLPLGSELSKVARMWRDAAKTSSIAACKRGKPLCPCKTEPDIWVGGPNYALVDGPFPNPGEARDVAGNPRKANLAPESSKHWNYDKERKIEAVEAACNSLTGGAE